MSLHELFTNLFMDLIKLLMVVAAFMIGKAMGRDQYGPEYNRLTFWQRFYTYLKGLFGCGVIAVLIGVGTSLKITAYSIEIFLLMAIPCVLGIAEGDKKINRNFKKW